MSVRNVSVDRSELEAFVRSLQSLECAYAGCPGFEENHQEGVTCIRCAAVIQANSWLPEGERVEGVGGYDDPEMYGAEVDDNA